MHMSGDHRQAFEDALDAYFAWDYSEPDPLIDLNGRELTISQVCGLLWNCTDTTPSRMLSQISELDQWRQMSSMRGCTYAFAARLLKQSIAERDQAFVAAFMARIPAEAKYVIPEDKLKDGSWVEDFLQLGWNRAQARIARERADAENPEPSRVAGDDR